MIPTFAGFQDPSAAKYQRVRIGNEYFSQNVLCARYGLALFCFGPAGFRATADMSALECQCSGSGSGGHVGGDATFSKRDWARWLRAYADYLAATSRDLANDAEMA